MQGVAVSLKKMADAIGLAGAESVITTEAVEKLKAAWGNSSPIIAGTITTSKISAGAITAGQISVGGIWENCFDPAPSPPARHDIDGAGICALDDVRQAAAAGAVSDDLWRSYDDAVKPKPIITTVRIYPAGEDVLAISRIIMPSRKTGKSIVAKCAAVAQLISAGLMTIDDARKEMGL